MTGVDLRPYATAERVASLERCWGRPLVERFLDRLPGVAGQLAAIGFVPGDALGGGIANIVVAGTLDGVPVVAKFGPEAHALACEAAALRHWGSALCPAVHASGPGWLVLERLGDPDDVSSSDDTVRHARLATVGALADAGPAPALLRTDATPARRFVTAATDLGMRRNTDTGFLGKSAARCYRRTARTLADRPSTGHVVVHGDLHPGNWFHHGPAARVIDPHAWVGPRAADVASLAFGGLGGIGAAVDWLDGLGRLDDDVRLWLCWYAIDRAGALVYHGWDRDRMRGDVDVAVALTS